jgi:hypothetical protein
VPSWRGWRLARAQLTSLPNRSRSASLPFPVKVLENAGLITRGREAQWRPCKLNPEQLKTVDDWLDDYRRFWEESFDRLGDYLQKLKADRKQKQPKEKTHVRNCHRKR